MVMPQGDVSALRALRLMDARTGGYHHRQRLCQPSGLDECKSVWIDQSVLHMWPYVAICGHYSQAALRAVGPLNPPAPYSPGQSPGGEGGQAVCIAQGIAEYRAASWWAIELAATTERGN